MWIDADDGEDFFVPLGECDGLLRRLDARADGDHAVDAGVTCPPEERRGSVGAKVEVRVGIDQAAGVAAFSIRASSSATTLSASSFSNSGEGSGKGRPGGSSLSVHAPSQLA